MTSTPRQRKARGYKRFECWVPESLAAELDARGQKNGVSRATLLRRLLDASDVETAWEEGYEEGFDAGLLEGRRQDREACELCGKPQGEHYRWCRAVEGGGSR